MLKPKGLWSRPLVMRPLGMPPPVSSTGVRPNSVAHTTSVSSSSPLDFKSKPQRLNAVEWIYEREAAGIAALLVHSLQQFIDAGEVLPDSKRIDADTAALNMANDRVGMFLNDETRCVVDAECEWSKSEMYRAYEKFCVDEGHRPFSARRFHEVMREHHGYQDKKVSGERRYVGVGEPPL